MKYITAIFYQEDGKDKVVYLSNPYDYPIEANDYTNTKAEEYGSRNNTKKVRARTFEIGVPSYDLR